MDAVLRRDAMRVPERVVDDDRSVGQQHPQPDVAARRRGAVRPGDQRRRIVRTAQHPALQAHVDRNSAGEAASVKTLGKGTPGRQHRIRHDGPARVRR